jgi:hypothetical protein
MPERLKSVLRGVASAHHRPRGHPIDRCQHPFHRLGIGSRMRGGRAARGTELVDENIHHIQHRRQERDVDDVCELQSIVCRRDRIAHQHFAMRRLVRLTIDIHVQERRFGEIGGRGDRLALEQLDEFFVLPAPGWIVIRS